MFVVFFFYKLSAKAGCANLIDIHASLQSSNSCNLNAVALVVELTFSHVVVNCETVWWLATVEHVESRRSFRLCFTRRQKSDARNCKDMFAWSKFDPLRSCLHGDIVTLLEGAPS